ncbi:unnamed protein product [Pleuronectes platessa]|uniref:Uncharacterized protein n=1 Tax=Pleuronectes platessa TaxID=8262 RepID=A0A9N7ZAQ6_PLEPL|nr:unnamed protein product [Pleuronectes platessa]
MCLRGVNLSPPIFSCCADIDSLGICLLSSMLLSVPGVIGIYSRVLSELEELVEPLQRVKHSPFPPPPPPPLPRYRLLNPPLTPERSIGEYLQAEVLKTSKPLPSSALLAVVLFTVKDEGTPARWGFTGRGRPPTGGATGFGAHRLHRPAAS